MDYKKEVNNSLADCGDIMEGVKKDKSFTNDNKNTLNGLMVVALLRGVIFALMYIASNLNNIAGEIKRKN